MANLALIIEDDGTLASLWAKALQGCGFDTDVVTDGAVAEMRLAEMLPDLIILDMLLPNVSGDTLLDQIKADDRLADTHVIVITSEAQLARNAQDKADVVLEKPVSYTDLQDIAQRLVS